MFKNSHIFYYNFCQVMVHFIKFPVDNFHVNTRQRVREEVSKRD